MCSMLLMKSAERSGHEIVEPVKKRDSKTFSLVNCQKDNITINQTCHIIQKPVTLSFLNRILKFHEFTLHVREIFILVRKLFRI